MAADNDAFNLGCIRVEREAEIIFEACAVECTAHADHAVLGQPRGFQRQVGQRIHRIGHYDNDGAGRIFDDIGDDTLHDFGVGADEFFAGHARFAGDARGDDHHVRIARTFVVVRRADEFRIKIHQRRALIHVEHLSFGEALLDVDENHFARHFAASHHICAGCAHGAGAYDGNFGHSFLSI